MPPKAMVSSQLSWCQGPYLGPWSYHCQNLCWCPCPVLWLGTMWIPKVWFATWSHTKVWKLCRDGTASRWPQENRPHPSPATPEGELALPLNDPERVGFNIATFSRTGSTPHGKVSLDVLGSGELVLVTWTQEKWPHPIMSLGELVLYNQLTTISLSHIYKFHLQFLTPDTDSSLFHIYYLSKCSLFTSAPVVSYPSAESITLPSLSKPHIGGTICSKSHIEGHLPYSASEW